MYGQGHAADDDGYVELWMEMMKASLLEIAVLKYQLIMFWYNRNFHQDKQVISKREILELDRTLQCNETFGK